MTSAGGPEDAAEPAASAAWRALVLLTAARTALGVQFQSIASVSGPLGAEIGLSQGELGTLIGLYFLPGVVMAMPGGALGARFGDKRVVMAGLALMAAGALGSCLATSLAGVAAGRLAAGVGAVLLNVLMTKMVTDWFSGRASLFLAMAIFVNSFPIGVGLAAGVFGPLAADVGWRGLVAATSVLAALALALVAFGYRPHPNDGARSGAAPARLVQREIVLVSIAGAIWGLFNGVFAVMVGLVPQVGRAAGLGTVEVSVAGGIATWLLAASILAGGALAPRRVAPGHLMVFGSLAWAGCLALVALQPGWYVPATIAAGLVMGLPVGAIMALPSRVLRPESRALGMGLFLTWLYVGHGGLPPLAGWLQDRTGAAESAAWLAAALAAAMALLYRLFTTVERAMPPQVPAR